MVVAGFIPSPLGIVTEYWPTWNEFFISMGVYAIGALLVTVVYEMTLSVRQQLIPDEIEKAVVAHKE
jgi:molybdopterin-containing oxidoreductase family membrane subunit